MPQSARGRVGVVRETLEVTLPSTAVGMLLVQPFIEFPRPLQEPFRRRADAASVPAVLDKVFRLARSEGACFLLFPEYFLPGLAAVEHVRSRLAAEEVPRPTVVIAGVHGLSREEYAALCTLPGVAVTVDPANAPSEVEESEWVNTSVTFVKDDDGRLSLYLQPKLSPAWPEVETAYGSMFRGSAVNVFRARFDNGFPCSFFSLLCFDWVGRESGIAVPAAVLTELNSAARDAGGPLPLQWAFVLQHNPKPNHQTFLRAANEFLTAATECPLVSRHHAAVVMVCTAGSPMPGRPQSHGFSSLIFSPSCSFDAGETCRPTYSTATVKLRGSDALGACKDVVFRERGECVHVCSVRVPNFVVPDVTDRTGPLESAAVHPLADGPHDPRLPGGPVPAVVKWIGDELDAVTGVAERHFQGSELKPYVTHAHDEVVRVYRRLEPKSLAGKVHRSCAGRVAAEKGTVDPSADADVWDAAERRGLAHLIETLSLLGATTPLEIEPAQLHARHPDTGVEILSLRGATHSDCWKAFTRLAGQTHSPALLVTRDDDNVAALPRELESFADPGASAGVRFTDAQQLLAKARASTQQEFALYVKGLMDVGDRRFI